MHALPELLFRGVGGGGGGGGGGGAFDAFGDVRLNAAEKLFSLENTAEAMQGEALAAIAAEARGAARITQLERELEVGGCTS
jgi:hypothetical protein